MSRPFDPGLQVERTSLAWTRTALALAVAGAVVARLTVDRLGVIAVVLGLVAVGSAVVLGAIAGARHRRVVASLLNNGTLSSDGRVLALAVVSVLAAGAAATLFVVWGMLDA